MVPLPEANHAPPTSQTEKFPSVTLRTHSLAVWTLGREDSFFGAWRSLVWTERSRQAPWKRSPQVVGLGLGSLTCDP